jgi:Protein of unknown function (DUF3604)
MFLIWAQKDPNGANLERAQIIKIWMEGMQYKEKLFNVAPAKITNAGGYAELKTIWEDPEFNQSTPAVYYLRVLESPTPRWSTVQTRQANVSLPASAPTTIRERGWSSPIWYTPPPSHDSRR